MKQRIILPLLCMLTLVLSAQNIDVSGYQLVQYESTHTYTIEDGTSLAPNQMLIISRNSSPSSFESSWGITLSSDIVFLNSGNNAPMINGDETYELKNAGGTVIDGPTATGSICDNGVTTYRSNTSQNNWETDSNRLPGSIEGITLNGSGLKIVQIGDNGSDYNCEYVQIINDSMLLPDAPSNFTAQATSQTRIQLSWALNSSSDNVCVFMKEEAAVTTSPTHGTAYNTGDTLSDGSALIYKGTDSSYSLTGLAPNTVYHFAIYSVDTESTYSTVRQSSTFTPDLPAPSFSISYKGSNYSSGATLPVGTLAQNANTPVTLSISNQGTASLEITDVTTTSGLTAIKTKPAHVIPVGKSSVCNIWLNPTQSGSLNADIDFDTNIGRQTLTLQGTVSALTSVPQSGSTIAFGDTISTYYSPIKAITVINHTDSVQTISSISLSNQIDFLRVDSTDFTLDVAPKSSRQLRYQYRPTQTGSSNGTVTFSFSGSTHTYSLSGTGIDYPQISLDTSSNYPKITIWNRTEGKYDLYRTSDLTNPTWQKLITLNDTFEYTDTSISKSSTSEVYYQVFEVQDPWAEYYTGTEGLSDSALVSKLNQIISSPYKSYGYSSARDLMYDDIDVENGQVRTIYTDSPTSYNCEHSWPQSLGASGQAKSDIHHLFPTNGTVNSARGSYYFGNVVSGGTSYGDSKRGSDGYGHTVFESRMKDRGDVARAIFYFAVMYNYNLKNSSGGSGSMGYEDILRQWHEEDPVDDWERDRNTAIQGYQENRNPFVDHPEFVDRISDF